MDSDARDLLLIPESRSSIEYVPSLSVPSSDEELKEIVAAVATAVCDMSDTAGVQAPADDASAMPCPDTHRSAAGRTVVPLLTEILQTVVLTLLIFAGVRMVVQNYRVDGVSMEPTFHSGQYLLVNKLAYLRLDGTLLEAAIKVGLASRNNEDAAYPFGGPQRGDVIVFHNPGTSGPDLVKRVIGLPGDMVRVDKGHVYVNGVELHEDYIRAVPAYSVAAQRVPDDHYFVLGDNRPNSSDSHIWGFLPAYKAVGKGWVSYWPPNQWGVVADPGLAAN